MRQGIEKKIVVVQPAHFFALGNHGDEVPRPRAVGIDEDVDVDGALAQFDGVGTQPRQPLQYHILGRFGFVGFPGREQRNEQYDRKEQAHKRRFHRHV